MCFNTAPDVPYQVIVVVFTSDGKGAQNDRKTLFSQQLSPAKVPDEVNIARLNFNATWTPLTLVEAQGFPELLGCKYLPKIVSKGKWTLLPW